MLIEPENKSVKICSDNQVALKPLESTFYPEQCETAKRNSVKWRTGPKSSSFGYQDILNSTERK